MKRSQLPTFPVVTLLAKLIIMICQVLCVCVCALDIIEALQMTKIEMYRLISRYVRTFHLIDLPLL